MRIAGKQNSPIAKILLNDIGPEVPDEALNAIKEYLSLDLKYNSLEDRMTVFKGAREALFWGPIADDQWARYTQINTWTNEDGILMPAFDAKVREVFQTEPTGEVDLWPFWDNMRDKPTCVLHGEHSPILIKSIIEKMHLSGPGTTGNLSVHTLPGIGHIPALMSNDQIQLVIDFFKESV